MAKKEEKLQETDTQVIEETETDASKVTVETKESEIDLEEQPGAVEELQEPEFASSETEPSDDVLSSEIESSEIDIDRTVTVQPIKFASFEDSGHTQGEINKNLEILMDIKLQLTVELGRTELPIKKVLELTRGSIIELEKVAGEPVELYANGKLVAHGEVVVIEDNFGLRITSITEPEDRLKGIG